MTNTSRRTELLHPLFQKNMYNILNSIKQKLPPGYVCKVISGHRTPEEQFELFKKGRRYVNGNWVKDSSNGRVVTNINGISTMSNHNYLPCLSIDIGIFDNKGKYVQSDSLYRHVVHGANAINADWGGNWRSFKDKPHIELSSRQIFRNSKKRETAVQWQLLLRKDGTYNGAIDGYFGNISKDALNRSVGSRVQNVASWTKLVNKVGFV